MVIHILGRLRLDPDSGQAVSWEMIACSRSRVTAPISDVQVRLRSAALRTLADEVLEESGSRAVTRVGIDKVTQGLRTDDLKGTKHIAVQIKVADPHAEIDALLNRYAVTVPPAKSSVIASLSGRGLQRDLLNLLGRSPVDPAPLSPTFCPGCNRRPCTCA